jgi:hypothetical protein
MPEKAAGRKISGQAVLEVTECGKAAAPGE